MRALVILLLAGAAPLGAQALRVQITDGETGRPLSGVIVDVLDARDAVVTQGVLSTQGRGLLLLPAAAQYRVRLRRIGYEPLIGPPTSVGPRDTIDVALVAPARRVALDAIVVTTRRCAKDAFADPGLAALWDEVGKALTTTLLSRRDSSPLLETRAFRRRLDGDLNVLEESVGLPRSTNAERPYVARQAAELAHDGYVRGNASGTEYFAPDEQVLLSGEFLSDHCFGVIRGDAAAAGLLGVHFTPANRRRVNDIAGTLWIDTATAELRYLDFWYDLASMPPAAAGEGKSGGQVVFQRLPSGLWIVGAWRLRMPVFKQGYRVSVRSFVERYEEYGGVVTPVLSDTAAPLPALLPYRELLAPARVSGAVFDSLAGRSLAGARVWLLPLEMPEVVAAGLVPPTGGMPAIRPVADTADAAGRYQLRGIPAGTYRLAFDHPTLDSLGIAPPRYDIRLKPGAHVQGDLALPSLHTLSEGCTLPVGASSAREILGKDLSGRIIEGKNGSYGGLVFGIVRSVSGERPLANALVHASWTRLAGGAVLPSATMTEVETRTDSLGLYRFCGVPDATVVTMQAAGPHAVTGDVTTTIGPLGVSRVNLRLAEVEEGEAAPAAGTLVGTVTDSLGRPVANTQVVLVGSTLETRADSAGRFRLANVTPGTVTVEVRRVGLVPARLTLDVMPAATTTVALTLTRTQLLDAMTITGRRNTLSPPVAEAVRRHRSGLGVLLTEETLKDIPSMQMVVHGISGVRTAGEGLHWAILMHYMGAECQARVFVDGHETDYDEVQMLSPADLAAVEVYERPAQAPMFTQGWSRYGRANTCGVAVFWTKQA